MCPRCGISNSPERLDCVCNEEVKSDEVKDDYDKKFLDSFINGLLVFVFFICLDVFGQLLNVFKGEFTFIPGFVFFLLDFFLKNDVAIGFGLMTLLISYFYFKMFENG